jgi:hypothetical protein
MDTQAPIDYWKMFADLMERRSQLTRRRDEAEIELARMKPLIMSVFPLLSEDQQEANQQAIDDMEAESAGLQDAIKLVFSANKGEWLTVGNVRGHLAQTGFDFRRYKANPLASIGTTMRRMVATGYLESKVEDGGVTLHMRRPDDPIRKLGEGARFPKAPIPPASMRRPATVPPPPGADLIEDALNQFKPKYEHPDPLNKRGKK